MTPTGLAKAEKTVRRAKSNWVALSKVILIPASVSPRNWGWQCSVRHEFKKMFAYI